MKAASGFEMTARVFCVIAVCSRLENGHLGTNGRVARKGKAETGKGIAA